MVSPSVVALALANMCRREDEDACLPQQQSYESEEAGAPRACNLHLFLLLCPHLSSLSHQFFVPIIASVSTQFCFGLHSA
jgi:hypothetical protein